MGLERRLGGWHALGAVVYKLSLLLLLFCFLPAKMDKLDWDSYAQDLYSLMVLCIIYNCSPSHSALARLKPTQRREMYGSLFSFTRVPSFSLSVLVQ